VRFHRADGFILLAAAERAFSDTSELMGWVCGVLDSMAQHDDMAAPVVESGGIRMLVDALRRHTGSDLIQLRALRALGYLVRSHAQHVADAPGVVPIALRASRHRQNEAPVQWMCFISCC
jgi:hypothetical protein